MPQIKQFTQEQSDVITKFLEGRDSLPIEETQKFIEENNLPWNSVAAFRMWAKANGFLGSEAKASTTRSNTPTIRGINKFGGKTDAMSLAEFLLQDKEKAISGAISQLEAEIENIKLEGEQQISIIKAAVDEQVATRQKAIDDLREQLPAR